jgi:hypothetical protein
MTTNILVSIAMAPFEPLEDREWAVIGGCVKQYRFALPVSPSNTDRGRTTDVSYFPPTGVIRKDRDASIPVTIVPMMRADAPIRTPT